MAGDYNFCEVALITQLKQGLLQQLIAFMSFTFLKMYQHTHEIHRAHPHNRTESGYYVSCVKPHPSMHALFLVCAYMHAQQGLVVVSVCLN